MEEMMEELEQEEALLEAEDIRQGKDETVDDLLLTLRKLMK